MVRLAGRSGLSRRTRWLVASVIRMDPSELIEISEGSMGTSVAAPVSFVVLNKPLPAILLINPVVAEIL